MNEFVRVDHGGVMGDEVGFVKRVSWLWMAKFVRNLHVRKGTGRTKPRNDPLDDGAGDGVSHDLGADSCVCGIARGGVALDFSIVRGDEIVLGMEMSLVSQARS